MRILLGYSYYESFYDIKVWVNAWVARLRKAGFEIDTIPLTPDPPNDPIWWINLDLKWKLGDKQLLSFYENLARKLENYDVFLNWNGINIHPEILKHFPTYNVYSCFDDPESSEILSKPVAKYYDLCMVGNIAEIEAYKSWGVKNVRFWPLGFMSTDFNPDLKEEDFYKNNRLIDISLLCEKKYVPERIIRLDKYANAFPQGTFYGAGWENGFYPEDKKTGLYQNTKIGPNFHNSTGPINFRTYTLPANGVMQICDNKKYLGKIFELNKEVVGFDTVEEAIDLTRYYLAHDNERIEIAVAGWKRALKEYNEMAVFSLVEKYVNELNHAKKDITNSEGKIRFQRRKTFMKRLIYHIKLKLFKVK